MNRLESGRRLCPICGKHTLTVTYKGDRLFLHCHHCHAKFEDLLAELNVEPTHQGGSEESLHAREAQQKAEAEKHRKAAAKAVQKWNAAEQADPMHPYFIRKKIGARGIKQTSDGKLFIPIQNRSGEIVSFQTIDANGQKRFLSGGETGGCFWFVNNEKFQEGVRIYLTEGVATGGTVKDAVGADHCVVVAFNADNMPKVAKVIRASYPHTEIVICADDDRFRKDGTLKDNTERNAGMEAGKAAARAIGGKLCSPIFKNGKKGETDLNDLFCKEGLDVVRQQIEAAIYPEPEVDEPEPLEESPKRKFRLESISDLIKNECPASFLIDKIIEKDSLASMFGASETLKTFAALDMGLCVATGIPWHGYKVKQTGPCLYICGEGNRSVIRRIKAWELHHGVTTHPEFFVSNRAAALLESGSLKEVDEAIRQIESEYGAPAIIIIDTLNRNMGAGDENSTTDMTALIKALDHIRTATGAATVVVHHTGLQETQRARGSSVLRGALDFEFRVSLENSAEKIIKFETVKIKDHEAQPPIMFQAEVIPLGEFNEDGEELTSLVLNLTDRPATGRPKISTGSRIALEALTMLVAETKEPVHVEDWRVEVYRRGISDTPGGKQRAFSRARRKLLDDDLVLCDDDFYSLSSSTIEPDKTRQSQTMSGNVWGEDPDRPDTTLKGVCVCLDTSDSKGSEKKNQNTNNLEVNDSNIHGDDPGWIPESAFMEFE